jgi:hypothetical protein
MAYHFFHVKLNAPELGEKITKALPKKEING